MSIPAYTHVWQLNITGADKLVMLALADHADKAGRCWIGYDKLAKKTGLSDRHIKRVVKGLQKKGYIEIDINGGRGNSNAYKIPLNSDTVSPFDKQINSDTVSETVTSDTQRVTSDPLNSDTVSPEPKENHKEPTTTTTRAENFQAREYKDLATYFQIKTDIAPRGITDSNMWEDDCFTIWDMAGGDGGLAMALMDEAIITLQDKGYNYNGPGSLTETISGNIQRANRAKLKRQNGANNGNHKRTYSKTKNKQRKPTTDTSESIRRALEQARASAA